ncbi:NADP-dependent oxidoreductase [Microbacterium sp. 2216-1]|uniref:NADP-dependent oxidoreductase n=1 Tax=Microbacterium sp. 2216-1 TaxID=3390053 RepID=UPI003975C78A
MSIAHRWLATDWGPPEHWRFAPFTVSAPRAGEVTIRVRAAGVNPADAKHVARARPGTELPVAIGYEVSGTVIAVGPDTRIVTGPVTVGDEVIAFRVRGGYATELTVPAEKVLRKPAPLSHAQAANLLLAGTTAAEMLHTVGARTGETVLLHGASGAVGVSVLQQAALRGIRVIGTARSARLETVRRVGGIAIEYGAGLTDRIAAYLASEGIARIDAALDAAGTDEAIATSSALVADPGRVVTIAAPRAASEQGFRAIAGSMPESARFRDEARAPLVALAESRRLTVPVGAELPLEQAPEAHRMLAAGSVEGKLALIP